MRVAQESMRDSVWLAMLVSDHEKNVGSIGRLPPLIMKDQMNVSSDHESIHEFGSNVTEENTTSPTSSPYAVPMTLHGNVSDERLCTPQSSVTLYDPVEKSTHPAPER